MNRNTGFSDMLRPAIEEFLHNLAPAQWISMKQVVFDDMTEAIQELFTRIVEITTECFFKEFRKELSVHVTQMTTTVPVMTMDMVHVRLGNIISDSFADAIGVSDDLRCPSAEKITELVAEEVTDRINLLISNGSSSEAQASETFSSRLEKILKHGERFLKRCAKIRCKRSPTKASAHSSEYGLNDPEPDVTASADDSRVILVTGSVHRQVTMISDVQKESPLDADYKPLKDSVSEDSNSPEIVAMICGVPMLETARSQQLASESSRFDSVSPPREARSWDTQEPAETLPTDDDPLSSVTDSVQSILIEQAAAISGIQKEAISDVDYKEFADYISQDSKKLATEIVSEVCEILAEETACSQPLQSGLVPPSIDDPQWRVVTNKVKSLLLTGFMRHSILGIIKKLRRMLGTPSQDILDSVNTWVDNITAPKQGKSVCVYESLARKMSRRNYRNKIDKQLCQLIFTHLKPQKKQRLYAQGVIKPEVDKFMKLMWEWLNMQLQRRSTGRDPVRVALTTIREVVAERTTPPVPPMEPEHVSSLSVASYEIADDSVVLDEVSDETEVLNEVSDDSVVLDEVSDETEVLDDVADGEEVLHDMADDGAATQPVHKWDRMNCKMLTVTLVTEIFKETKVNMWPQDCHEIGQKLAATLLAEIESSTIDIEPSFHNIEKIVKAVHKDLIKKYKSQWMVQMHLLGDLPTAYTEIAELIKQHLVEKKPSTSRPSFKNGERRFFDGMSYDKLSGHFESVLLSVMVVTKGFPFPRTRRRLYDLLRKNI
ncbi:uncharacterized protein V6R79_024031 [Siganus canaliculatus]